MRDHRVLLFALLLLLVHKALPSVLPKPLYRTEPSTTQLSHDSTGTGAGTIVLVTSSELPKQIPPPPTPTRPHEATPRYDTTRVPVQLWLTKAPPQTFRPQQVNFI